MSEALDRLAQAYGIEPSYISERGETCVASDATKRAVLRAMGVAASNDGESRSKPRDRASAEHPTDDAAPWRRALLHAGLARRRARSGA